MKTYKQFKEFITESEHPMIDVDGKPMHRNNSEGKPIHTTDEGIRNFHRWFNGSTSVDRHGRPKVMYHGSNSDIPKFDLSHTGKGSDAHGPGFYFADSPHEASEYADKSKTNANVIPAYVKVTNPIDTRSNKPLQPQHIRELIKRSPRHKIGDYAYYGLTDVHKENSEEELQKAVDHYSAMSAIKAMKGIHGEYYRGNERQYRGQYADVSNTDKDHQAFFRNFQQITGHDGVRHKGLGVKADGNEAYGFTVAFNPNQIKSSTGNTGAFSKRKKNIAESSDDI